MYALIRSFLFFLDPENAHYFSLKSLQYIPKWLFKKVKKQKNIQLMDLKFAHPVGLAAGLDKNGEYLSALAKLGFSFIEVGTVTPKAQAGNPKPRLFRVIPVKAIINRMGFNNHGIDVLIQNIKESGYQGILGINIGKNKDTPLGKAEEDYVYCLKKVYPYASYITINISSPNTPELRELQQANYLDFLLSSLTAVQQALAQQYQRHVPLLVKISPDETDETIKQIAELALQYKLAGIIATNTTSARPIASDLKHSNETGGLSGQPLLESANRCLKLLKSIVGDELVLIGVGGIGSLEDAQEKLNCGADLIQLYTGLIYQGPGLISKLVEGLKY